MITPVATGKFRQLEERFLEAQSRKDRKNEISTLDVMIEFCAEHPDLTYSVERYVRQYGTPKQKRVIRTRVPKAA